MKLKDVSVTFYKQCDCEGTNDVVVVSLHDLAVAGPPICDCCEEEFCFRGEDELWDTY